jgi:hypothetical protein
MEDKMETGTAVKESKAKKNASAKPKRVVVRKAPVPLKEVMKAYDLIKSGTATNNADLLNAGVDAGNIKRIVNTLKKQGLIKLEVKYVTIEVVS